MEVIDSFKIKYVQRLWFLHVRTGFRIIFFFFFSDAIAAIAIWDGDLTIVRRFESYRNRQSFSDINYTISLGACLETWILFLSFSSIIIFYFYTGQDVIILARCPFNLVLRRWYWNFQYHIRGTWNEISSNSHKSTIYIYIY